MLRLLFVLALLWGLITVFRWILKDPQASRPAAETLPAYPSPGAGKVSVPVNVVISMMLVVPIAFLVDTTVGLVATAVAVVLTASNLDRWRALPSRPDGAASSNVAFDEWKRSEEDRINQMRATLDQAETDFLDHVRRRREEEDLIEFMEFQASRNKVEGPKE